METLGIEKLSVGDLHLINELSRTSNLRETARRLQTQAGAISKRLQNIERKFGFKVFERSPRGLLLTTKGSEGLKSIQKILKSYEELENIIHKDDLRVKKKFGICGTSFMISHLITKAVLMIDPNKYKLTFINLSPEQMINSGLRGAFEICIHADPMEWPTTWYSEEIGEMTWSLYASGNSKLKKTEDVDTIKKYDFVLPTYWSPSEGFQAGNDLCPLSRKQRNIGAETTTADAAVQIVEMTEMISFLPDILCTEKIKERKLKKIKVNQWKEVKRPVYLSVRSDYISQNLFGRIKEELIRNLA
jgi:DNA-binding transcriptional LysR family regulator